MRPSSWALVCGTALAYGIYESAFAASVPAPFNYFKPLPAILVLMIMLNRYSAAYLTAALAGMAADLTAAGPSGNLFVRWLLMVCVIDFFSENLVTNRSLFGAVMLVSAATVADGFMVVFGGLVLERLLHVSWYSGDITAWIMSYVLDLVFVSISFVGLTMFTRRFLVTVSAARPAKYEP